MTIAELEDIISSKKLDRYLSFYMGGLSERENSLSLEQTGVNSFSVRKVGERGMKKDYKNLAEEEACDICMEYFSNAKLIYEYNKKHDIV